MWEHCLRFLSHCGKPGFRFCCIRFRKRKSARRQSRKPNLFRWIVTLQNRRIFASCMHTHNRSCILVQTACAVASERQTFGVRICAYGIAVVYGRKLQFDQINAFVTKISILTGVLQGIAVLPGVSRSGATISALTLQGVDKSTATTFSFCCPYL